MRSVLILKRHCTDASLDPSNDARRAASPVVIPSAAAAEGMGDMRGSVVTIGTFDGVHVGHQAILAEVDRAARARRLTRIAYVFVRPPRAEIGSAAEADLLLPFELRLRLVRALVDRVVLARFRDVRDLSPDDFAERVVAQELAARCVVVGSGFRYGRDRSGDLQALRDAGSALGFEVREVNPVLVDNEPASSTRARDLLRAGDISRAARLLGRPPVLVGPIVPGDGIGTTIGYPTANLAADPDLLLPGDGIYLAHVFSDQWLGHGLVYVGSRPTVAGRDRRCEIHLLSPPADGLEQASLEVHLLERLRDDRRFPSLEALKAQIEADVRQAEALRSHYPTPAGRLAG
jgi:riboflavin kinase/FMN adenylyltransferase